ncbi:MAG: hypothetical protein HZB83_08135, partial [Deltaproteobacteria bacterium]|nr:hypothetical protein [Deltaproteobacteria bacterium]
YHMGADDEAALENAVVGLTALLMKRYEPARSKGHTQTPSEMPLITVGPLKEKTFRTDIFIADSFEKKLAEEILLAAPYADSAILFSWLSNEGHGRKLAIWLAGLIEKAMKEEAKHGGEEKTAYLAMMAAVNTLGKKRERIKAYRSKGLSYEKMDLAVGLSLYLTFRNTVIKLMDGLREAGAQYYNPSTEAVLLSITAPRAFISIQSNLLAMTHNPYGITNEVFDALAPLAEEMGEYNGASAGLTGALANRIKASAPVLGIVKEAYPVRRFRENALRYMMEFDIQGTEAQSIIHEIYHEDRLIKNLLCDPGKRDALRAALEGVKKKYANDAKRSESISPFQEFLSSFKSSVLKGLLKSAKKEAAASLIHTAESYWACSLDNHAEKFGSLMRGYLSDRRGEFTQTILLEEYNRGRLYRFSTDNRPILKTLETEEEGQLFIDMKNFTRKTLKVKEIAMAEFMKEYFYEPILTAASRYAAGSGVVKDERGIVLTSLPGDAAVFSGGVAYLVALARDIQQIIARYREQLAGKLPPGKDAEILEEVHKRFEARKEELKERRAELTSQLERNEPGIQTRLIAAGEEEHKLENTYRDELESAIKGELEAGLFISYGAKAETMVTEAVTDFYGPVKVSIGGKINEASRGTFRNPLVRAKLEILIEEERQKGKQKNLKYPFNVYIDRTYSIKMPPELESAFEKLISNRKLSGAQAMAQIMAQEFFTDLKKIISG